MFTPPLDGTILPGLTRASVLRLTVAHGESTTLPNLAHSLKLHTSERRITMEDLFSWYDAGKLAEIFLVGTAAVVAGVGRVGFEGRELDAGAMGSVAKALYERLTDIQEGKVEFEGWCVSVEDA